MKHLQTYSNTLRRALMLVLSSWCISAFAGTDYYCDFQVNGIYYKYVAGTSDEVAVSYDNYETGRYGGNYTNYTGSITVPAAVTYGSKTYKVTAVTSHAFEECSVTHVHLPSTIKSIGVAAFLNCSQLLSMTLPQTVTTIGASAFNGCVSMLSANIPEGVTEISDNAFNNCQSLRSITIPSTVTAINSNAFYGCSNLSSIVIPNSIESVQGDAFYGTAWYNNQPDGLLYVGKVAYKYKGTMPEGTEIALTSGTTMISSNAFLGCSGLKSIDIPEGVTSIGSTAFSGCINLTSVTIPKSVTSVGSSSTSLFYGCTSLKEVTVLCPTVAPWMFRELGSLENVTFGEEVKTIGSNAFYLCKGLTSVTIPENVTGIDSQAFANCI